MKGVWDGGSYSTTQAGYPPRTVLMVNANSTPDDLKLESGVRSKVSIITTPIDRLVHRHKLQKTKQLVKEAQGDHVFFPSVLGLGMSK